MNRFLLLQVLFSPKAALDEILKKNERFILLLISLGCAWGLASKPSSFQIDNGTWLSLLFSLLISIFAGFIGLLILSKYLQVVGKIFGGNTTTKDMLTVVAWSFAPASIGIAIYLIGISFFGTNLADGHKTTFSLETTKQIFVGTKILLSIWGAVILVKGVMIIQQFSLSKAIFSVLTPVVILYLIVFSLTFIG